MKSTRSEVGGGLAEKDDPDLNTKYPTKAAVKQGLLELHDRAGDSGLTDAEQELQKKLSALWKH